MEGDEGVRRAEGGFVSAGAAGEWYKNLKRRGSCKKLYDLLKGDPRLLHQAGTEGVTALHKAVRHGYVKLTRHILVDMFDGDGNCTCGLEVEKPPCLTRDDLLRQPFSGGVTAVHLAIQNGTREMVLLIKWAIDMSEFVRERRLAGQVQVHGSSAGSSFERVFEVEDEDIYLDSIYPSDIDMEQRVLDTDVTEVTRMAPEVPDVTDAGRDGRDDRDSDGRFRRVYEIIEGVLNSEDADRSRIEALEVACTRHVDYEFSPPAHVFLHFLGRNLCQPLQKHSLLSQTSKIRESRAVLCGDILEQVIEKCNSSGEEGLLEALFNLHDPQGRTFLGACEGDRDFIWNSGNIFDRLLDIMESDRMSPPISRTTIRQCLNARDAAGRTLLHHICICDQLRLDPLETMINYMDFDKEILPICGKELQTLLKWCFPRYPEVWLDISQSTCTPIHLMALFNSTYVFNKFVPSMTIDMYKSWSSRIFKIYSRIAAPLEIAAFLGRTEFLEGMLEHHTKYNSIRDPGLGTGGLCKMPAILCAAAGGQVEAIQSILKYPVYDPIVEDSSLGTALHVVVKLTGFKAAYLERLQAMVCVCTLPNSRPYKRIQRDFSQCEADPDVPRMYSANEKACINVLLQAGIDIWTPHPEFKQMPTPGPIANDDANAWWYDKVVREVVDAKTSISYASNATSVVAALVATASFIGPFQPPLGYTSDEGYVRAGRSPVRVYLVCNSLSFFFSVGSILMAVLPAIPMPKESLYDELVRSRRCLKASALLLLVSIMCFLMSFSSASIAVVSDNWRERRVVVACIVCGGIVCLGILVVYIIRLMRMVFHRNAGLRRRFAKYMYF